MPDADALAAMRQLQEVSQIEGWSEVETRGHAENAVDLPKIRKLQDNELDNAEFVFDPATFKKVMTSDLSLNQYHKWSIFLWMREYYGISLSQKREEESLRKKEELLYGFNKLVGLPGVNVDIAKAIGGHYHLYRPFYLDPLNKIFIQKLTIGSSSSIFDCSITGNHEISPGKVVRDRFTGKIVPQGDRIVALLQVPTAFKGTITAHFDHLDIISGGEEVRSMGGLMVTAIGNARTSAWPMYAVRVERDTPIIKAILAGDDIRQLPSDILDALDRGAIHWQPQPSVRHFRPTSS